ncbi:MAG: transporter substrate-binding domain-containing protein [Acetobacterales bacterium]
MAEKPAVRSLLFAAAGLIGLLLDGPALAAGGETPDEALARMLAEAKGEAARPDACMHPDADRLVRIFCDGSIRIGVRDHYPLFGMRDGDTHEGYDVDTARAIAAGLGVEPVFETVNAASRIPMLAADRIDLTIATMGHNTQRDGQVRFIRPHYYQSETILVGARSIAIEGWGDIVGRSICVTIGNGSNAQIISHGARLMLFDEAGVLPERLGDRTCTLAAQDDSFFAYYLADPDFAGRYEPKFGFAQVPWGMAVARSGSGRLGDVLDLMSQLFHRDGVFLEIARGHRIATGFLERQRAVWNRPDCDTAAGNDDSACVLPALDAELEPTGFAAAVTAFERRVKESTGVTLSLAMLKTKPAWTLFRAGVINSLILVAGALVATLAFALLFGMLLAAPVAPARWVARALTMALQSSPVVLTLVIVATIAHALFAYSSAVALGAAIVALGLANGCNAGQAISEALRSLHAEEGMAAPHAFRRAVGRSATQIVSFLINAAKGTPVASFVGAPELLSALTDITSFASGRATTYGLLLLFYILVVGMVVWLCGRLRVLLERGRIAR